MANLLTQEDFPYAFEPSACDACEGNCCIGESGYIWITKTEIQKLALHLNISVDEVGLQYLMKVGYRYSIKEKQLSEDNYACVFFDMQKKQCSIYEARPSQCKTFPFWDYFKHNVQEVKDECPAIRDL